eukprot:SAG11_NODE_91_length_17102_cov_37.671343_3_plen_249_part_00
MLWFNQDLGDCIFEYHPFVLREDLFGCADELSSGEQAEGTAALSKPVRGVVSLDTIVVEGAIRAPASCQMQEEELEQAVKRLESKVYATWFMLYSMYVQRVAEKEAERAAVGPSSEAPSRMDELSVVEQRQERQEQQQQLEDAADARRAASASAGLSLGFEIMDRITATPDEACYRALMAICAHSKLGDDAKAVFGDMVKNEIIPDTITYNAFVQAIVLDEDDLSVPLTRLPRCAREHWCLPPPDTPR